MFHTVKLALGSGLIVVALTGSSVASTITFTFDSTSGNTLDDNAPSSSNNSSTSTIQKYMNKAMVDQGLVGATVTVTGAKAETNNSYTGDNHVVGPVLSGATKATSMTLGNSEGARSQGAGYNAADAPTVHTRSGDGYIFNSDANMFSMVFSFAITSVSFDYEIFPNGTCGNPKDAGTPENPGAGGGSCSRWPDFTLKAGVDGDPLVTYLHAVSQDPAEPGYVGYTRSPITGTTAGTKEKAPQLLAVSGLITFASPATRLEFWDWPERVAIDNLKITTTTVPESTTLLSVGIGSALVMGVGARFNRRRRSP